MNRIAIIAAASCVLFAAAPAMAHDLSVGVALGSASGERHGDVYDLDFTPKGTVATINIADSFTLGDHFVLGVEAEGQYGKQDASRSEVSCTIAWCGYDETVTRTKESRYALRLGASLGHPVGPVLVSALAGVEATDYTDRWHYVSPTSPTWDYSQTGYRLGYYYGLRAEYPITDRVSVRTEWKRSDLSESESASTAGSSTTNYLSDTVTLGLQYRFN